MAEQQRNIQQRMTETTGQGTRQTVKFLTAATIGTGLLVLSGLTMTVTVVGLVLATPVMVLFSPVLVPAGIVVALAAGGFFFSGGFGVAALSALAWIYNYVTGKHPLGADQLDSARLKLMSTARDVKERAKEYGHYVQNKAHEVTSQTNPSP
ncbi:oleosin family protein [Wolffia australiana]